MSVLADQIVFVSIVLHLNDNVTLTMLRTWFYVQHKVAKMTASQSLF